MADKDANDLTQLPVKRPSGIGAGVTQQLAAIGVPEEKHAQKIADAKVWWFRSGICGLVTLLFLVAAFLIVYQTKGSPSVVLYIALATLCGLPALATLFCASQADGEATKAFIDTVLRIRKETK